MTSKPDQTLYLGYLYFLFLARESVLGGCLVIDQDGYPQDFRYSMARHPDPLQKALYGQSLQPYLIDSMTASLLNELVFTPNFFLTNYRHQYSDEAMPLPVFYLDLSDQDKPKPILLNEKILENSFEEMEARLKFPLLEPFQRVEEALEMLKDEPGEEDRS